VEIELHFRGTIQEFADVIQVHWARLRDWPAYQRLGLQSENRLHLRLSDPDVPDEYLYITALKNSDGSTMLIVHAQDDLWLKLGPAWIEYQAQLERQGWLLPVASEKPETRGPKPSTPDKIRFAHTQLKNPDLNHNKVAEMIKRRFGKSLDWRVYYQRCYEITGEEPITPENKAL